MNSTQLQLLEDHILSTPGSEPVEPCEPLILMVREMARRDWALRVLDAWTRYNGPQTGRWYVVQTNVVALHQQPQDVTPPRFIDGATPDAARHAAALVAWPQLTHEQCQEIGPCP